MFDLSKGTTQRGVVRVVAGIAIAWAGWNGRIDQVAGILAAEKAINGMLGIVDKE